jgi:hypothetical protein
LVEQNPEQVFKFSRGNIKSQPQECEQEHGTLLTDLIRENESIEQINRTDIAPPTIATNVIVSTATNVLPEDDEDDYSFFGVFSGGGGGYVDRPSKEQEEQEEKVREQLFSSELIGVAKINEAYSSKIKIAERAFIEIHGQAAFDDWKIEKPEIRVIGKQREEAIHAERLRQMGQSILFKPLEECPVTNPNPEIPIYNPTIQSLLETEEANIQAVRSATIDEVLQSPMFQMDGPGAANDETFVPLDSFYEH